uniref:Ig-like domain-containing protein n=1 Tax=Catharus ustulatus TaxID=91951 RepID=A0A8C3Y124_CATUS
MGREMRGSSRAGAKAEELVAVPDWILWWEQPGKPSWMTISPAVLTLPEGNKATFFCNISVKNDSGSDYRLNWYKEINHSQRQKTAEISRHKPMTETEKYRLSNPRDGGRQPLRAHQGYAPGHPCAGWSGGAADLRLPHLHIQERRYDSPGGHANPVWDLGSARCLQLPGVQGLVKYGACAGDGGYLQMLNHHNGVILQKEEKPPVVSISTVDYGVLEFQRDQCTPVPPKTWPVEQTEYATIVFPEEKPVTPERGKKHLDERTRQLPSQPC